MALSTVTIAATMEWAKKLSFNRNSAIGNNLEPALTSANMIMQTILGPPFTWWWNNEELGFTTSTTFKTATITNVSLTANIVTITAANSFAVGDGIIPSTVGIATFLNGQLLIVLTATASLITAALKHPDYVSAADTGTLTSDTTQDYTLSVPDFSHIEHASVYDVTQTPNKWYELKVQDNLAKDSAPARPRYVNPHVLDGNGNITFRLMPPPDAAYPVSLHVQKTAPILTSSNQTWAPIPDYMRYVYDWGFLALIYLFADDARFGLANQKFMSALLGRAQGITEEERNIFLNNWNGLTGQQQAQNMQGIQARGV